ncbi:hypothetical protein GCM10023088_09160 [Actinomadura verrucosospora]
MFAREVAPFPEQCPDARQVQVESFQEQHREEQPGLAAGQPYAESAAGLGVVAGEGDRAGGDVGVAVDLVGVGVVLVVLGDPPAVAETDQQVAVQPSKQDVDPLGTGDLLVARVVAEERGLGERGRQERRHRELPPGRADQHEGGPARGEEQQVRRGLHPVVAGPPGQ